MAVVRRLLPALAGILLSAAHLGAQEATGNIKGTVVDSASKQPLTNVSVTVEGTSRRTITRADGSFDLTSVPAGTQSVRVRRIGFGTLTQNVTVPSGGTVTVEFGLVPQAAVLTEMVVTGYGSQRREAITGSVATIDANVANVGVVSNATQLIQGRVAGVSIIQNNGEPGAGAQIRIRGGTSISASNDPLYVIDGVAIENVQTEPGGVGVSGEPPLPRNPLNTLNPADIESITILKDAAATAIYGARAANGVILIETKKGSASSVDVEYDGYLAMSAAAKSLDLLNGDQYRAFVQGQVDLNTACNTPVVLPACSKVGLPGTSLTALRNFNTNWEDKVTRESATSNQNLSFTGGGRDTRYRASVNYMDQQGVALANGFKRLQGRLNGTHQTFSGRLRLGLNLTTSQVNNKYLPFNDVSGFEGGVFTNMVNFNPTFPVDTIDPTTGLKSYYEIGKGAQSVRNPVALAEQIDDVANTNRNMASATASFDVVNHLTAQMNLGVDRSRSRRETFWPAANPVGAVTNGLARQEQRDLQSLTLQNLLNYTNQYGTTEVEVIGGYEYNAYDVSGFGAEAHNFLTDAFGFNNLGAGATLLPPFSFNEESKLVSFFSRANVGFQEKYFVTGVLRRDGSSKFGEGNKWAVFPAVSASWRLSSEDFMRGGSITDLRLRAGWGLQGNPAVPAYASLIKLESQNGARYPFGGVAATGVAPTQNENKNLKWEQTTQTNVALDFGYKDNLLKGSIEYYNKDTKDLLLTVSVPQPAAVSTRLENIGRVNNKGLELNMDAQMIRKAKLDWILGGLLTIERNKVVDLGGRSFIATGDVSGQGQSGQVSQRILPGQPLGTFYGPRFIRVETAAGANAGKQLFKCVTPSATCVNGETTAPAGTDYEIIGNANPKFSFSISNQVTWGNFDLSALVRSDIGKDVFNNTALVYSTKGNALQNKNFLSAALSDPTDIREPAIFSSRWIEKGSFVRLQNITLGYTLPARLLGQAKGGRVYVSGDNVFLITKYKGYDPEVHVDNGLAARGTDYLTYPRARTFTTGVRLAF
jgi:iron complex outermembrane receptor protein